MSTHAKARNEILAGDIARRHLGDLYGLLDQFVNEALCRRMPCAQFNDCFVWTRYQTGGG